MTIYALIFTSSGGNRFIQSASRDRAALVRELEETAGQVGKAQAIGLSFTADPVESPDGAVVVELSVAGERVGRLSIEVLIDSATWELLEHSGERQDQPDEHDQE